MKFRLRILWSSFLVFNIVLWLQCCKKDNPLVTVPDTSGEGEEYAGGSTTIFDISRNAFGHSAPNLQGDGPDKFAVGNSFFRNDWVAAPSSTTARDGVGPLLNSFSCSSCHKDDGRGRPPLGYGEKLSSMLVRLSIPGANPHNGPLEDLQYGDQLSNNSIPGVIAEGDVTIDYTEILGAYSDGAGYSLRKPQYTFVHLGYGALPADILFSPRVAPQMPGLGLLEAISETTLLSFTDSSDLDGDGISGRPNYVWDFVNNKVAMGRFGWKANQPSLKQQTAGAFIGDMGISSPVFSGQNLSGNQVTQYRYDTLATGGSPEISTDIFDQVVFYSSTLAVPGRRNWTDPLVKRGKQLFTTAGCAKCHIPSMTTGADALIPELANQKIFPYTDLLLHDMGPALADGRPDYLASGQEWRTPPLWGIGLIQTVSGHTFLLHDGRARNAEEAILWHGGEGEQSKNTFTQMSKADRDALLKFLTSL